MNRARDFAITGRLWRRQALTDAEIAPFDTLANSNTGPGTRINPNDAFGPGSALAQVVTDLFPGFHAVRAMVFAKTETANWGVPWHQDRIIPVAARHHIAGFHNWSEKAGVWHCEPPLAFLNQMFFVRLYLDATDALCGPMEIAFGRHTAGFVPASACETSANAHETESYLAARGDLLILHMLTLHCSLPAKSPSSCRTLRVDFAAEPLPAPLQWAA